jgi:hypothetical protein
MVYRGGIAKWSKALDLRYQISVKNDTKNDTQGL